MKNPEALAEAAGVLLVLGGLMAVIALLTSIAWTIALCSILVGVVVIAYVQIKHIIETEPAEAPNP